MLVTPAATAIIESLRDEHGPLMFFQGDGDSASPMCFEQGEFRVGATDVWLGRIQDCSFFVSASQFEKFKYKQITVDVVKGHGTGFSLEGPLGVHFLTRSRPFTQEEQQHLAEIFIGEEPELPTLEPTPQPTPKPPTPTPPPALAQLHRDLHQLVQAQRTQHPVLSVSEADAPANVRRVLEQVQTAVDQQQTYWHSAPSQGQLWQAQQEQRQAIEALLRTVRHDVPLPYGPRSHDLSDHQLHSFVDMSSFNGILTGFLLMCRLRTEHDSYLESIDRQRPSYEDARHLAHEIAARIETLENNPEFYSLLEWAASQTYPVQLNPEYDGWARFRFAVHRLREITEELTAVTASAPPAVIDYFTLFNEHLLWLRLADEPDEALLRQGYRLLNSAAALGTSVYQSPLHVPQVPTFEALQAIRAILALSPFAGGSLHHIRWPELLAVPSKDLKNWLNDLLEESFWVNGENAYYFLFKHLLDRYQQNSLAVLAWRSLGYHLGLGQLFKWNAAFSSLELDEFERTISECIHPNEHEFVPVLGHTDN